MMAGVCCVAMGLVSGVLALALLRSARRASMRDDLKEAWMAGAEKIPPPERIYVVAVTFMTAQWYIRSTGEDPTVFKIILHPDDLLGLDPGPRVIVITDEFHDRRFRRFVASLAVLRADVRYVSIDQMTGVQR